MRRWMVGVFLFGLWTGLVIGKDLGYRELLTQLRAAVVAHDAGVR